MMNAKAQRRSLPENLVLGLIASVPMGMVAMMLALVAGMGFFEPLRLIASALLGEAALIGVFPIVLGAMLHMMTGAVMGLVYGLLVSPAASTPTTGVVYGLVVWAGATLSLGFVAPLMAQAMPHWLFAMAHVVYGVALARLARR